MSKVAVANVSEHPSKEILSVQPRREKERSTSAVTGDNLREEMPIMEKERNGIVRIFRSWFVSAECPRRQQEDVIGIGVDINWERGIHPWGSTRLQT